MSKTQLRRAIKEEIEKLNRKIDLKIVRELDYRKEAKEHKRLFLKLKAL